MVKIGNGWDQLLKEEFESENYRKLRAFLKQEYQTQTVYPDMYHIFEALKLTPPEKVKVVILGQDPYHGSNQAHGLSFSVQDGVAFPPSLRNIFEELNREYGIPMPDSGDLSYWAKQGVLLLNATLTVRESTPMSHAKKGWEQITDAVIRRCAELQQPVVYLLWGNSARAKKVFVTDSKGQLVLETVHPSPLSAHRGFFGCGHFKTANEFLIAHGQTPIDWDLRHR